MELESKAEEEWRQKIQCTYTIVRHSDAAFHGALPWPCRLQPDILREFILVVPSLGECGGCSVLLFSVLLSTTVMVADGLV